MRQLVCKAAEIQVYEFEYFCANVTKQPNYYLLIHLSQYFWKCFWSWVFWMYSHLLCDVLDERVLEKEGFSIFTYKLILNEESKNTQNVMSAKLTNRYLNIYVVSD